MTIADWAICAVVLVNVIAAAMQGFFSEALSIAGLVVGYIVAAWKYRTLAEWFESFLKNPWLAEILGFLIIFFAILILFGIAARIARWLMKKTGLSGIDRFLGAVLGLLKGVVRIRPRNAVARDVHHDEFAPQALKGFGLDSEVRARFYQGLDLLHQAPQKLSGSQAPPK